MTMWELAKKLYAVGYSHEQVRSVWVYAYQVQKLPQSGRRRKPWQAQALEEVEADPVTIDFGLSTPNPHNYF